MIFRETADDGKFCEKCTTCCQWPGVVLFSPEQLAPLAKYLGMSEHDCAEIYFEVSDDRQHLRTKDCEPHGCIFLTEKGCSVYDYRPDQCRTFPYSWQRPEKNKMKECGLYQELLKRTESKNSK